jgi:DNA-binding MarR family transcriptional regulator
VEPFYGTLEKNIAIDFHHVYMAMNKRLNEDLLAGGIDITAEQVGIMVLLWQHDGRTQQEIVKELEKDKASITRLLHGLERRGLVRRVMNGIDKRNKNIYLTKKGRGVGEKTVAILQSLLVRLGNGISHSDINICRDVLLKMTNNLAV